MLLILEQRSPVTYVFRYVLLLLFLESWFNEKKGSGVKRKKEANGDTCGMGAEGRLTGSGMLWPRSGREGPEGQPITRWIRTKHNDTSLWKRHDKLYTSLNIIWKQDMKMQNVCSDVTATWRSDHVHTQWSLWQRKRESPPSGSNGTSSAAHLAKVTQYDYNLEIFILILHRGRVEVEIIDFYHCNAKNYFLQIN